MNQRHLARRRGWRRRTKVSLLIILIVASVLIYWEQTAVLYLLSTLFICTLLLLVAFADLESRENELSKSIESGSQSASPGVLTSDGQLREQLHPAPEQVSEIGTRARSSFPVSSQTPRGTDSWQR